MTGPALGRDTRRHAAERITRPAPTENDIVNMTKTAALLVIGLAAASAVQASDKGQPSYNNYTPKTVLTTPPLVPDGKSQLDCYIFNVSDKAREVLIEALDKQGNVVADWTETLAPSHEAVAIAEASDKPRACRFIVEGQPKHFRASGLVVVPGIGSVSALAAQ
jgi:hypothetical protein